MLKSSSTAFLHHRLYAPGSEKATTLLKTVFHRHDIYKSACHLKTIFFCYWAATVKAFFKFITFDLPQN